MNNMLGIDYGFYVLGLRGYGLGVWGLGFRVCGLEARV